MSPICNEHPNSWLYVAQKCRPENHIATLNVALLLEIRNNFQVVPNLSRLQTPYCLESYRSTTTLTTFTYLTTPINPFTFFF